MKFLLLFISLVFSFIFYIFYNLSKGKDIFGSEISNYVNLISFSGNLLIESFIFLLIGILFLYIFSDFKEKSNSILLNYKYKILYFFYYIVFFYSLFFQNFFNDNIILLSIILFIFSDLLFNHISNFKLFLKNKLEIRIIGLIINYFSSILIIYYLFINKLELIPIYILTFNIVFNIFIHRKYTNYISLLFSIFSIVFLFYILYLQLFELYINYI